MLGLIIAFGGIGLGQAFDMPVLDGVASVLIGIILAIVARFLAYECKGLLVGEAANKQVIQGIRGIVESRLGVKTLNELLNMHLGPDDILVNLSVDFEDGVSSETVEAAFSSPETEIKKTLPRRQATIYRSPKPAKPPSLKG